MAHTTGTARALAPNTGSSRAVLKSRYRVLKWAWITLLSLRVCVAKSKKTQTSIYRVNIIGYSVEADSYLSWFEQSQLDYDGEIQFKEPVIEYQKTVDKHTV
jgi:hypothetical protein